MESIIIYEDNSYHNLFPIVCPRPVFDLECEINTVREKIIREYKPKNTALFCRDYLKEKLIESDCRIFNHGSTLVINKRVLVTCK